MFEAEYRKYIRNGMAALAAVGAVAILVGVQYGLVEHKGRFYFLLGAGVGVLLPLLGFALITTYYLTYAHLASKGRSEQGLPAYVRAPQPARAPVPLPPSTAPTPRPPLFAPRRTDVGTFPRRGQ